MRGRFRRSWKLLALARGSSLCCKKCQYEYRKTNKYIKFDTYYKLILQNKENIEILIDLDDFEKKSNFISNTKNV